MTENESQASTDGAAQQPIVTSEDFAAVDFEAPIRDSKNVDCRRLAGLLASAASEQEEAGNDVDVRVFGLLAKVAFIHLKPEDLSDPYGPLFVCGDQRTVIPNDLKGEQSCVFADLAPGIENPGLRARLSDVAWHNERKRADMATLAIRSYCESVQLVLDGQAEFYLDQQSASSRPGRIFLHRACQIAKVTGWKNPEGKALKSLIQQVLQEAFDKRDARGFLNIGKLCLRFRTHAPAPIAACAETLASAKDVNSLDAREVWKLAAQIHRQFDEQSDMHRCHNNAAERLVTMATDDGGEGAAAASFYSDAIEELRSVPNTKERRKELEKLLRKAQTAIPDEMSEISKGIDLPPLVEEARSSVTGATLAQALWNFAMLATSPDPTELRTMAKEQAEKNPLWGDMPFTEHDCEGKVVTRSPGLLADGNGWDEAVRRLIACNEILRRQREVQGCIEPARCVIQSEHSLDRRDFLLIAIMSPFVPSNRADVFALGFDRFFAGDFISAVHVLVPQLENAVRHVLLIAGEETSTIRNDMTQENLSLPAMLKKHWEPLENAFGPAIVFDMENVFVFEGGTKIRHQVAHGLISGAECFSPDAVYACWFIFRLCCLPLLPNWSGVSEILDENAA